MSIHFTNITFNCFLPHMKDSFIQWPYSLSWLIQLLRDGCLVEFAGLSVYSDCNVSVSFKECVWSIGRSMLPSALSGRRTLALPLHPPSLPPCLLHPACLWLLPSTPCPPSSPDVHPPWLSPYMSTMEETSHYRQVFWDHQPSRLKQAVLVLASPLLLPAWSGVGGEECVQG